MFFFELFRKIPAFCFPGHTCISFGFFQLLVDATIADAIAREQQHGRRKNGEIIPLKYFFISTFYPFCNVRLRVSSHMCTLPVSIIHLTIRSLHIMYIEISPNVRIYIHLNEKSWKRLSILRLHLPKDPLHVR